MQDRELPDDEEGDQAMGDEAAEGKSKKEEPSKKEEDEEVIASGVMAKPIHSPRQPTKREIEGHDMTHMLVHAWFGGIRPSKSAPPESRRGRRRGEVSSDDVEDGFLLCGRVQELVHKGGVAEAGGPNEWSTRWS